MKLKEMRIEKCMTQEQLSEKSGVSVRTIQAYECGLRRIDGATLETLCRFAIALDCRIRDIIEGESVIQLFDAAKK